MIGIGIEWYEQNRIVSMHRLMHFWWSQLLSDSTYAMCDQSTCWNTLFIQCSLCPNCRFALSCGYDCSSNGWTAILGEFKNVHTSNNELLSHKIHFLASATDLRLEQKRLMMLSWLLLPTLNWPDNESNRFHLADRIRCHAIKYLTLTFYSVSKSNRWIK